MPKGKVTINGVMVDLGNIKLFNKKERVSKTQTKGKVFQNCKDYGIEFIFYSGSRKTIWWFHSGYYSSFCDTVNMIERDNYYEKLTRDFGIKAY